MRCRRCHRKAEGDAFLCGRCAEEAKADASPVPADVAVAVGALLAAGVDPIALGFERLAERVASLVADSPVQKGSASAAVLVVDHELAAPEAAALCGVPVGSVWTAVHRLRRRRALGL